MASNPLFYYLIHLILTFQGILFLALFPRRNLLYCTFIFSLLVFSLQPHKEERFIFPLYPIIALLAAQKARSLNKIVLGLFLLVSVLRSAGLYNNYHGSIDLFMNVKFPLNTTVCLDDTWHYFPSHFLADMSVAFTGNPKGCMPIKYQKDNPFRSISQFNKRNLPNPKAIIPKEECDIILSFEGENPIICVPFLNRSKSPPSTLDIISRYIYTGKDPYSSLCFFTNSRNKG